MSESCILKRETSESGANASEQANAREGDPDALLGRLRREMALPEREFRLYVRYLRALALLCECAPYVDEEDYVDLIDELLAEACSHYPLEVHRDERYRAIAPRVA
jgi:hypothetical protein